MSVAEQLGRLEAHGLKLWATYPFAALIGAELRASQPAWWLRFAAEDPERAGAPARQAADYAFCAWAEESEPERFYALAAAWIEASAPRFARELVNTVEWFTHGRP